MPSNPSSSPILIHRINNSTNSITAATTAHYQKPIQKQLHNLVPESIALYHAQAVGPNQSCSAVVQEIAAPVSAVWSVVRRFDNPQAYKNFIKSCHVVVGDGDVGTLREVHVISGLPACCSTERLEILDDEHHIMSFSMVGGDHRLANYRSVTTVHSSPADGGDKTVAVESYVVDIPPGNTKEETVVFVDTILRCNLQSLAQIALLEEMEREMKLLRVGETRFSFSF